jgi:Ca2+/Na+ antiporter
MNVYLLGNLAGRAIVAYLLVWLTMFVFSRFRWQEAFRRTHRWYGLASAVALFAPPLAIALAHGEIA